VAKTIDICVKFLSNVAYQKLLKSVNVSWSYWKNKSGTFLWTAVSRVIVFLHSSTASGNNKEYFTAVFKYKYFFWNILLKTT